MIGCSLVQLKVWLLRERGLSLRQILDFCPEIDENRGIWEARNPALQPRDSPEQSLRAGLPTPWTQAQTIYNQRQSDYAGRRMQGDLGAFAAEAASWWWYNENCWSNTWAACPKPTTIEWQTPYAVPPPQMKDVTRSWLIHNKSRNIYSEVRSCTNSSPRGRQNRPTKVWMQETVAVMLAEQHCCLTIFNGHWCLFWNFEWGFTIWYRIVVVVRVYRNNVTGKWMYEPRKFCGGAQNFDCARRPSMLQHRIFWQASF